MPVRNYKKSDRDAVLAMVDTFYHSPAVEHDIPLSNYEEAYDEMCDGGSSRMRGLLIEQDGAPAGFCSLALTYSTEAGGPVVLIEEIFTKPEFRGKGLGQEVFQFLREEYAGKAARIRLEVVEDNHRAISLYERMGFKVLPYKQMILEDF